MNADVSVVIPCYNSQDTVERAFRSVNNQTLKPAEILFIDDASKDNTLKILESIQRTSTQIPVRILTLKSNSGPGAPRNLGWDNAKSKYIAFLDSDDYWHPLKIATQYTWMQDNPECDISGHSSCLRHDVKKFEAIPSKVNARQVNRTKMLVYNAFRTSSVMQKREISVRFNEGFRYSQDYLLWLEIILNNYKGAVLNFTGSYYFKHLYGAGGQTKNLSNGWKAELKIYDHLSQRGQLSFVEKKVLSAWSSVKFIRRRAKVAFRTFDFSRNAEENAG
jgi:glycosyltransferase involved in cell wall biosynthesis